jgi:hypothetical protein
LFLATEAGIDLRQHRESARIILMSLRFYFRRLARRRPGLPRLQFIAVPKIHLLLLVRSDLLRA